ncbi:Flavin-containing monooxygenase-family [Brachionus plicatilis]|uniref:Flavin-containing monooxygenase n=1 Tax=Brachionus plicatilis TaxID=10195 RepID=A0A3M7R613_BRAPC|nr:Flavin-containing monooxygenase-family [Brachionus plicatilis]
MQTYRVTINIDVTANKSAKKRVAIIGAGPAGLVSAKTALENGLVPVIFDRKSKPGGLWSAGTAIWDDMHTNVSKYSVMFSDFPWPKETSVIPSAKDVLRYLKCYIKQFKLNKRFRLNSNVESVKQMPNKKWKVTWTNYLTGELNSQVFDFLICSNGLHCRANLPQIKNSDKFCGIIMHSTDYRSHDERLKNKKIVVVGNSYSGVEISAHLVGHAFSVTNVFKRPYLVFPRLLKFEHEPGSFQIVPIDLFFGREITLSQKNPKEERDFKINLYKKLCPDQTNKKLAHPDMYYKLDNDEPIRESVTDNYYPYVKTGLVKPIKSEIKQFEKNGLVLENGLKILADVVIFCTGYKLCLDYFDHEVLKILKFDPNKSKMPILMYKYTVHPDLENLAMVGEINGLYFAGFEMQANWAIKLFCGTKKLPPRDVIDAELAKSELRRENAGDNQFPRGTYNKLIDELAEECDLLPDMDKIKMEDEELYRMMWENGTLPCHFCFNKNRDLSIKILREVDEIIKKNIDERLNKSTSLLARKLTRVGFKIMFFQTTSLNTIDSFCLLVLINRLVPLFIKDRLTLHLFKNKIKI